MLNKPQANPPHEKLLIRADAAVTGPRYAVPDGVTALAYSALSNFDGLASVTVPPSVRRIGERAFADCPALEEVILHEGLEAIGSNAFTGCVKLRSVVIPDSVKELDGRAFIHSGLAQPVLNRSGRTLYHCPASAAAQVYAVPDGVRRIAGWAFMELPELREVTLPKSLERIDEMAFVACGLRRFVLPKGVAVGKEAFFLCDRLDQITLPGALSPVETETARLHLTGRTFLSAQNPPLPAGEYWRTRAFRALAAACAGPNPKGAERMARFFAKRAAAAPDTAFYGQAANFWRYRAWQRGGKAAGNWLNGWLAAHPGERLPSAYLAETLSGTVRGRALNALGFPFFEPERAYILSGLDDDGIVQASAYAGEDGPDEDGFGREIYYDWWYLNDVLSPAPGVGGLFGLSRADRQIPDVENRFQALREATLKHERQRMRLSRPRF